MGSHYQTFNSIKSIDDIKKVFPKGEADDMNWCVLSTSGVHGTYLTIEDAENFYNDPSGYYEEEYGEPYKESDNFCPEITVLIIHPRLVSMKYGNVPLLKEDIPYLKKLVNSTLHAITASQLGNLE